MHLAQTQESIFHYNNIQYYTFTILILIQKILNEILEFIEEHHCVPKQEMHMESKIEKDLGITGDDACEILVAFGKKFHVDVAQFMAADYFNAEGASRIWCTYNPNLKTLTIGHMVKASIVGRLDESVINDNTILGIYS